MDGGTLYDPAPSSRSRARASSFSASSARAPADFASSTRSRRQSVSSLGHPSRAAIKSWAARAQSDGEAPLVDLGSGSSSLDAPSKQDPLDAAADKKLWRDGRQSKQQMEAEYGAQHNTTDFDSFLAQLYDLTHAIDALENDIDDACPHLLFLSCQSSTRPDLNAPQIVSLRNMVVRLDPKVDVGQVSLRADLDSLAALTTKTGKGVVALETWLGALQKWGKQVRELVKAGQVGETMKEVGEIKYHLASARLDFEDALERIREGAFKEKERRQRTRIWMARHIRSREPYIEDKDVKGLLKAAELGSADGVAQSHVTSYAGLFALQNPFTELAELTNAKHALPDSLDREIVDEVTGKSARKARKIVMGTTTSSRTSSKRASAKKPSGKSSSSSRPVATSTGTWGSRFGLLAGTRDRTSDDPFERKFNYIQQEQFGTEKDLEYGFARQKQQERINRRKKLTIALLLVVIAALILFVTLATMRIPDQQISWDLDLPKSPEVAPFPSAALGSPPADIDEHTTDPASDLVSHMSSLASSLSSAGASIGSAVSSALSAATSSPTSAAQTLSSSSSSSGSSAATSMAAATSTTVWWTPPATPA
ncbi:hypothetical protein JCM3775_006927 [Rhodotorula graminis]